MKKTALLFLLVSLLSGCAGYAAQYPLCSVLPAGSAGCQPSQNPLPPFALPTRATASQRRTKPLAR